MREFLITPHIKSLQNAAEKLSEVPCISKDCNSKIELWLRRENKKVLNNRWELKAKKQLSYRGGSLPGSLNIAFEFYLKFAEGPSTQSSREFAWKMKNAHFLTTILKCEFRLCMCSWWKCSSMKRRMVSGDDLRRTELDANCREQPPRTTNEALCWLRWHLFLLLCLFLADNWRWPQVTDTSQNL